MTAPATAIGADPHQLLAAARAARAGAQELERIAGRTGATLTTLDWRGPDAARFRHEWNARHRRTLREAAGALRRGSSELERHALEQELASAGTASPTMATRSRPVSVGDAVAAAPGRGLLPELPLSETRFSGGVELRAGVGLALGSGELTIAELPDGRVRVTVAEASGIGVVAGAGATLDVGVGDETMLRTAEGMSIDGRARLGGLRRTSWEVDADRVDDLLIALALRRAAEAAPMVFGPIGGALSMATGLGVAAVQRLVGSWVPEGSTMEWVLEPPDPSRTEVLGEVEVSGNLAATLPAVGGALPGLAAAATSTIRAGTSTRGRDTFVVVETSGSAAVAPSAALAKRVGVTVPRGAHGMASSRWEFPTSGPSAEHDPHLLLRVTAGDGGTQTDHLVRIDLRSGSGDADLRSAVVAALRILARGDTNGSVAAVEALNIAAERVTVTTAEATVEGNTARARGSASAGAGLGITARGQRLQIDRQ